MTRLLVAALLLHHIEGVCRPWSGVKEAAQRILAGLVEHSVTRDREAAARRSYEAQAAAVERARRAALERGGRCFVRSEYVAGEVVEVRQLRAGEQQ